MAKMKRVHEVASECDVTSQEAMQVLRELGEFVKSPSSALEPPVARKLAAALQRAHGAVVDADDRADHDADDALWFDRMVTVERRYLYRGADGRYEALAPRDPSDALIGHQDWTHTTGGTTWPWLRGYRALEKHEAGGEVYY